MKVKHYVVVLDITKKEWNEVEKLKELVRGIVKTIGVQPIGEVHCTRFEADPKLGFSEGFTLHQTIGQSSIDLHTFFENGKIIVDILACGEEINISTLPNFFKDKNIDAELYKVEWKRLEHADNNPC